MANFRTIEECVHQHFANFALGSRNFYGIGNENEIYIEPGEYRLFEESIEIMEVLRKSGRKLEWINFLEIPSPEILRTRKSFLKFLWRKILKRDYGQIFLSLGDGDYQSLSSILSNENLYDKCIKHWKTS